MKTPNPHCPKCSGLGRYRMPYHHEGTKPVILSVTCDCADEDDLIGKSIVIMIFAVMACLTLIKMFS